MLWFKRNLFLVIGAAVSLAMLGGAGYYLYDSSEENFTRDDELAALKVKLDQLKAGIYPSDANISLVKSNVSVVNAFMSDAERLLAHDPPRVMKVAEFNINLARVIDEMRREATNAGVEIPPKYEFTFGEVKVMTGLPTYALPPLVSQLGDIRTLSSVLFKAKVRALESLGRVKACDVEPPGADLLTDRLQQTNALSSNVNVIITPYRVVFRGFSGDLAAVINGISSTKEFIVVRQIDVDQAGAALETPGNMMNPSMNPGMTPNMGLPGMNPGLPGAPINPATGLPGGPTPGMAPPARPTTVPRGPAGPAQPVPKSSLAKVLDETPLRVTLALDVVRLVRKATPAPAPAAPPPVAAPTQ
jgi:hypothetical protein